MTLASQNTDSLTVSTPDHSGHGGHAEHADLAALVGALDLEQKVTLLTGATTFTLAPEESIGLGELRLSDGPTGVRGLKFSGGRTVSLFPNATLLASAWSEETAHEVGRLLAQEALAQEIHVVLGPTINLHRSLLGGRLFEAYSEDPLLSGRLAAAYVRGLQDNGVGACLKHLVANESETQRNTVNSVVDEATLRELYLLPFEIAVADSSPWSIMAAYNDVNGVAATEQHHVNNEIVKGEWGYDGLIMSDWHATKTAAPAAAGGLDLVMPGPAGPWGDALVAAVRSGELEESVVDDHVRRLLLLADRVGALGQLRDYPDGLPAPDGVVRREQLTRLAAGGMTVLTNKPTGSDPDAGSGSGSQSGTGSVLPLTRGQRIALIGRHAVETIDMGGGSAQVNPPYQVSVAEGLQALLGESVTVTDGVEVRTRPVAARAGFVVDADSAEPGVQITLLAADGSVIETRHSTGATTVVGFDDDFDETVHTVRFRARLAAEGPVQVGAIGVGQWQLSLGDTSIGYELAAAGTGFGEAILAPPSRTDDTSVEAGGDVLEASVVLRTRPATGDDDPMSGAGMFGVIARTASREPDAVIADAVEAATAADVAVVVVGLTEEQETEAVDKSTLQMPGSQDAMVRAVAAAAPRTVVVVNAATPVLMPWLDEVDAVLWAGLPGQEGGHAVAAALLGDIEPAGRLVTTFPTADAATPAWSVTPVDGDLPYDEGTFIGYRGHDAGHAPDPAFWLGHGLGYSTWEYSGAEVRAGDGAPSVSVTVTNTGTRDSKEVVQLYFRPAAADQPVRLVGWAATAVAAGVSSTVNIDADPRMWRRWDTAAGAWDVLPPGGQLLLARGLGDVRATLDVYDV